MSPGSGGNGSGVAHRCTACIGEFGNPGSGGCDRSSEIGPAVAGVADRGGGDVGGQLIDEPLVAASRSDGQRRFPLAVVDEIAECEQQRRVCGQLHERACAVNERGTDRTVEPDGVAQVPVPVVPEIGARRDHRRGRRADELHGSFDESRTRKPGNQIRPQRFQCAGVGGKVHRDLAGEQASLVCRGHDGLYRFTVPRHHHRRARVDHRQLQPARCGGDQPLGIVGGDAEHRHAVAARQPIDHLRAGDDDRDGIGKRDGPGDIACGDLSEAVADGDVGKDPAGLPHLCKPRGVGELRGLGLCLRPLCETRVEEQVRQR